MPVGEKLSSVHVPGIQFWNKTERFTDKDA